MSGTSQWAMSEPIIAWSSAPNGLTDVLNAVRRQRVVGLAPEVEGIDEQRLDVLGALDAARRPLVEHVLGFAGPASAPARARVGRVLAARTRR